eukprot:366474-Chlamydomonas_euryale.AAC.32
MVKSLSVRLLKKRDRPSTTAGVASRKQKTWLSGEDRAGSKAMQAKLKEGKGSLKQENLLEH